MTEFIQPGESKSMLAQCIADKGMYRYGALFIRDQSGSSECRFWSWALYIFHEGWIEKVVPAGFSMTYLDTSVVHHWDIEYDKDGNEDWRKDTGFKACEKSVHDYLKERYDSKYLPSGLAQFRVVKLKKIQMSSV